MRRLLVNLGRFVKHDVCDGLWRWIPSLIPLQKLVDSLFMNLWGNRHTVTCNRTVYSHMKENHYKIIMVTEEVGLFFVIVLIRLLPEVSVPRSLKVSELWTLQSGIKEIQWYHRRVDNSGMCQSYVFGE